MSRSKHYHNIISLLYSSMSRSKHYHNIVSLLYSSMSRSKHYHNIVSLLYSYLPTHSISIGFVAVYVFTYVKYSTATANIYIINTYFKLLYNCLVEILNVSILFITMFQELEHDVNVCDNFFCLIVN